MSSRSSGAPATDRWSPATSTSNSIGISVGGHHRSVSTDVAVATARLLRRRLVDHELWLPVNGLSMQPPIAPPAQVRVVARARPRLGEVWAFAGPDGTVIVHRYERRSADGLVF